MIDAHVLITNDDGIRAPGLVALAAEASLAFARVSVVAPKFEQSASSHALTIRRQVHVEQIAPGWHEVEGTPADCVNLAFFRVLGSAPDLVLSGVNRGYNLGEDVTYSGTVAGALEGRMLGAPSLAISTLGDATPDDFAHAARIAVRLGLEALRRGLPEDALLNVNVPPARVDVPPGTTRFRVTRQGRRMAREGLAAAPKSSGEDGDFYWVGLAPSEWMPEPGADHTAIADGLVSVTPLHADRTFVRALPVIESWGLPGSERGDPERGR